MSEMNPEKMKVAELRDALEARGLDTKGTKPFLVDRLKEALLAEAGGGGGGEGGENKEAGGGEENGGSMMEEEGGEEDMDQEQEDEDQQEVNGVEESATNGEAEGEKKAEEATAEEGSANKGVKRKHDEAEESKPWIIRENEPEIDENFLCLDWYNSDFNLKIVQETMLTGIPFNRDSWSWVYAGARATHGFTQGKIYFEVKLSEHLKCWTDIDEFRYDVRVGWSTNDSSLMLGESATSWCYSGNTGKKVHNSVFEEYGEKFERPDTVGAFLDINPSTVTMTWTKNGTVQEGGFTFPTSELAGQSLFPHVLTRNTKVECNFGKSKAGEETKPLKELPEALQDYTQAALVPEENRVRGTARIATREECEVIMMVGLPSAGKTTWAKNHAAAHPEKKFEIINAAVYLEKATCNGESRKNHVKLPWDKVHHRLTKSLLAVIKVASSRRRNIILDQTNVYGDAQLRKARPFEKMVRKCVVVVPSNEEWERRRAQQETDGEKNIPDEAVMEMKANLALPKEDNKVFDEVIFAELQREEAQAVVEQYNKESKEKGYGKKHEEYKTKWEANKRGRFHSRGGRGFGHQMMGRGRGFGMMGGNMRGGMMRGGRGGGGGGGWNSGWGGYGGGAGAWGGYGGGGYGGWGQGAGGGGWGQGYGARSGPAQYPGRKTWGGWGR